MFAFICIVGAINAWRSVANNLRFALWAKPSDAKIHSIAYQSHARWVFCGGKRVLRQGDAYTAHALRLYAITMRKVAIGSRSIVSC